MNQTLTLQILCAIGGLFAGSVVVYSAPRVAAHRVQSQLPYPGKPALIPLIGPFLSGRRRFRAILVQVLLAAVFAGLAIHYGASIRLILSAAYCLLLVTIAYVDLEHRLVLNRLSYPGIILALGASTLWPGFGIVNALLGALAGLAIMGTLEFLGRGALGTGDTKLAVLIGAMRGLPGVLSALFIGVLLGGLGAAFFLFVLRRGRKDYIAYAPYLSAGAVLSFFLAGS
jgi:prepilin signal peptidase PulO-like enzyme (type II secretory pathway)